jgi:hypothetical protein
VGHAGVAFSPLADYTPRASGLRRKRQCDVPTLVLITTVRPKKKLISIIHPDRPRCTIPFAKAKVLASFWSRLSSFASIGKNALAVV